MTRRDLLLAAAPPLRYRDYSRVLPDYLRTLAARAYQLRNSQIAALTTPAAIRKRQEWVAETFWKLVGGKPESTPLNARVAGSFERTGYKVDNVVYESRPGFHIPANLYLPTSGRPPYPGVLFQMGHAPDGKAYPLYQTCCQGLARLGFVVLAFDPMGQGERTYYPGPNPSRTRLPGGADDEHTIPGKQMLLVGDSAARMQAWDAVRSLDYLASHPMVDPARLASTGQSGGGTVTMMLCAVDQRLAAAAVACGNTENVACANFNPPGSTDDAEQDFPGAGPLGFDRWDLLYPIAPKPLLVLPSAQDFAGTYSANYVSSGIEEFDKLRSVYATLGEADKLAWEDSPLPHSLTYAHRLAIYNWFRRWLRNEGPVDQEPPAQPEPERTLFAAGGSTVRKLGSETPLSLLRKRPKLHDPGPVVDLPRLAAGLTVLSRTEFRNATIEAVEIESEPQVHLPGWLYKPKSGRAGSLIILLDPLGRTAWQEGALCDTLCGRGNAVCALDIRGIGHMTPEIGRGSPRHNYSHRTEQHYSWASMILGRPLLHQRVADIVAAVRALGSGLRVTVAARGILTPPAVFAAFLEPAVESLVLVAGLESYASLLDVEEFPGGNYANPALPPTSDWFGAFVPGLLARADLPGVAASIAPRRVTKLAQGWDAESLHQAAAR
jgi:dienelactone hydrolase